MTGCRTNTNGCQGRDSTDFCSFRSSSDLQQAHWASSITQFKPSTYAVNAQTRITKIVSSNSEWHTHREAAAGVIEAAFAEGGAVVGIAVAWEVDEVEAEVRERVAVPPGKDCPAEATELRIWDRSHGWCGQVDLAIAEAEAPLEGRVVHLEEAVEGAAHHEGAVVVLGAQKEARRPSSYGHTYSVPAYRRPLTSASGTPSPPRSLRRPRQRRLSPHQEPHPRRIRLRRKAHLRRILRPTNRCLQRRHTRHKDRIPCLEPFPLEACRRYPRRPRRHLHQTRRESPLPRRRIRHLRLPRRRHRRTRRHSLRCRVLAPLRARSHQHGYAPHKRHPHHRRRPPPSPLSHARLHGRCHLRRRRAARSGAYCGAERTFVSEGWWGDCGFGEGELYW